MRSGLDWDWGQWDWGQWDWGQWDQQDVATSDAHVARGSHVTCVTSTN
jgi:hypothetical protein